MSPERKVEMSQNTDHRILSKGAILAAIGLILAIVSAFYISAATAVFGIMLGGLTYARGGRRFAVVRHPGISAPSIARYTAAYTHLASSSSEYPAPIREL